MGAALARHAGRDRRSARPVAAHPVARRRRAGTLAGHASQGRGDTPRESARRGCVARILRAHGEARRAARGALSLAAAEPRRPALRAEDSTPWTRWHGRPDAYPP